MRRMKSQPTLNQSWALPGPQKRFIRLHSGFLWLCCRIRSGLRFSQEASRSLSRLFPPFMKFHGLATLLLGISQKVQVHSCTAPWRQIEHKNKQTNNHEHSHWGRKDQRAHTRKVKPTHTHPKHSPLALSSSLYLQCYGSGTRARGYNTRHLMLKLPGNLMSDIPLW